MALSEKRHMKAMGFYENIEVLPKVPGCFSFPLQLTKGSEITIKRSHGFFSAFILASSLHSKVLKNYILGCL